MGGGAALRVDDAELPVARLLVARQHRRDRRAGVEALGHASSAFGPWATSATDCVATAPTPGRAHDTTLPTENQCDCTATPSSPLAGSRATIE